MVTLVYEAGWRLEEAARDEAIAMSGGGNDPLALSVLLGPLSGSEAKGS